MDNDNEQPTHVPHGDEPISDNRFDNDDDDSDESVIVSRQVVWDCICGEQNFTDLPAEYVVCAECGQKFSQFDIAGDDGTYEQTMYDEGETYFDAFVPDFPDTDDEPDMPDFSEDDQ